ncbi:MAG: hypothetical protein JRI25_02365 [Deltaproteobacteria bacterium]|nr:hypothetical protein [Deltaproteobacteria bacterium]MBW2253426.1 hypothetical protein [Deltaproteobacteria bacterium]
MQFRTALAALVLFAGCDPFISPAKHRDNMGTGGNVQFDDTGGTSHLDDTGEPRDDTGGGEDTSPTHAEYPVPWHMAAAAVFGYDTTSNEIRSYNVDDNGVGGLMHPTVLVQFMEQGGLQPGPVICTILIRQESPSFATDLGDAAVSLGWMVDWTKTTVEHDCEGKLDPEHWGTDLEASLADVGIGVGITGTADANLIAAAQAQAEANDLDFEALYASWMVGARFYLEALGTVENGANEFWYARGMQVDSSFNVLWNDLNSDQMWQQAAEPAVFHPAENLLSPDGNLPSGAYLVDPGFVLAFGAPLHELLFP